MAEKIINFNPAVSVPVTLKFPQEVLIKRITANIHDFPLDGVTGQQYFSANISPKISGLNFSNTEVVNQGTLLVRVSPPFFMFPPFAPPYNDQQITFDSFNYNVDVYNSTCGFICQSIDFNVFSYPANGGNFTIIYEPIL